MMHRGAFRRPFLWADFPGSSGGRERRGASSSERGQRVGGSRRLSVPLECVLWAVRYRVARPRGLARARLGEVSVNSG